MAATNGSYVTRAELAAHVKGIDEHFDGIEETLSRIEAKLTSADRFARGRARAWFAPLVAAVVAAAVAIPVALLTH